MRKRRAESEEEQRRLHLLHAAPPLLQRNDLEARCSTRRGPARAQGSAFTTSSDSVLAMNSLFSPSVRAPPRVPAATGPSSARWPQGLLKTQRVGVKIFDVSRFLHLQENPPAWLHRKLSKQTKLCFSKLLPLQEKKPNKRQKKPRRCLS